LLLQWRLLLLLLLLLWLWLWLWLPSLCSYLSITHPVSHPLSSCCVHKCRCLC
jgi:hypothetical protein